MNKKSWNLRHRRSSWDIKNSAVARIFQLQGHEGGSIFSSVATVECGWNFFRVVSTFTLKKGNVASAHGASKILAILQHARINYKSSW